MSIRLEVRYEPDNDLAEGAFLSAVPTGPNGRALPPVDFDRESAGVYALNAAVDADGRWSFDITSRFPPGSTTVTVAVGSNESGGNDGRSAPTSRTGARSNGDGGNSVAYVGGLAGIAVFLLGLVLVLDRRSRSRTQGARQ